MKHSDIIAKLSLEQKCALLSGKNTWQTQNYPKQGVPAAWLSDGPPTVCVSRRALPTIWA